MNVSRGCRLVRFHLHKAVICYMTLYGNNIAFENHWAVQLPSHLPVCTFYALHTADEGSHHATGWQKTATCQGQIICPMAKKPWELQDPGHCPASLSSVLLSPYFTSLRVFMTQIIHLFTFELCVFPTRETEKKNKAEINLLLEYTKALKWNSVL